MKYVLSGFTAMLLAASTSSADVRISMSEGRVSVVATDATVRQILTEWARVGQTKIVNVERVPGGPISLELTNVPEAQALEVLLRSLSGYITAPRQAGAPNLSQFDRIIIMPTVASARPAASSSAPPPVFPQAPQYTQPPADDQEPDDQRPPAPGVQAQPNRGPVFNTFPQPQVVNQQPGAPVAFPGQPQPVTAGVVPGQPPQPPANTATPSAPFGGVAVPGMIVQPPQQPGQPQPGQIQPPLQPGQVPPRRPGGQN
jgi:hypothetical protein